MSNLVPYTKSPTIKPQKSAIIKIDKFFNGKSVKANVDSVKPKKSKDPSEDIILKIEKKVIKIDKLLKDSFALKKKQQKKSTIKGEQKEFEDREKELEKKKPKKQKGVNLPTPPKMGFLDWIKNFITQTVLGFIAVRLIDFLPQLLKLLPVIIKVTDFITDIGGKLLDGLVTFIDWGYKAYDATRGFIKNIFGEDGVKQFDQLSGVLNKFLNLAIIAGLVAAGSGGLGKGAKSAPGKGGRSKVTTSGGGGAGRPDIRNPLRQRPNVTTSGGGTGGLDIRNPLRKKPTVTTGGGGTKGLLRTVRPFLKRIPLPVVGALIDFGLSVALGENPGRAAFRAIGAGILGAVGAAVGSVIPVAGNLIGGIAGGILGDMAGGALYDLFFNGKKPTIKQVKTNNLAGGGKPIPSTGSKKSVGRTLKKKKKKARSLSFIPPKIKPGKSAGGEDKVQSVFPNPEKQWWDPFGLFSGKSQQQEQQKKPTEKVANPQEFLLKSNDVLGRSDFFGPFFTLALKSVLGDRPNKLDYLKVGQGLNSWMQTVFKTGPLGFAGGGEVDAKQFFGGEDYTQVIAKSVEDSVSKEIDTTIRNLKDELSLRKPVGKEEMIQENIQKGTEGTEGTEGAGGGGGGGSSYGSPEMKALLDILAYAEGTAENRNGATGPPGYSTWAGYQIHGPTDLTTQTIQQVHDLQTSFMRSGKTRVTGSAVVGRYQFKDLKSHFAKQAGLKPNDFFSPENQDKMAIREIERAGVTTEILRKNGLNTAILDKLAPIWASIPYSPKGGRSYYGQAYKNPDKLIELYNKKLKIKKEESIRVPSSSGKENLKYGNQKGSLSEIENLGKSMGLNIVSKFRPGSRGYHGIGRAIDFQTPGKPGNRGTPQQMAFAQEIIKRYGKTAKELIYTPLGFGIKKGKQVPLTTWGPLSPPWADLPNNHPLKDSTNAIHYDHVHVAYEKGGETLDGPHQALIGEKGTEYVIDADSYRETKKIAPGLFDTLNYDVKDKASLIKYLPNIIASLSQYTDYENPNQEPQIIYIEIPVEVPVPIATGGGGNIFISGGVNSTNNNMEQTLSQIG